ncbi:hypothetical protein HDU92_006050 [Lobulomyces angularis]|nr:hypothetical protein HDU92_006050 [Lobulomyces angularis]
MDDMDIDENYEEEVSYQILNISNEVSKEELKNSELESGYAVIGLESETPYIRIGEHIFEGKLRKTIGTDLIFEKKEASNKKKKKEDVEVAAYSGFIRDKEDELIFVGKSEKKFMFDKVILKEKPKV